MFYDSISYSTLKARRELGFEADMPLREGIEKTVHWYKANGHI